MAKVKVPQDIKVNLPKEEAKKEPRTIAEIQEEFTGICTKAGHLEYQIFTYTKDLELLNQRMRDLNFEAAASQAKTQEAQQKSEAPNA